MPYVEIVVEKPRRLVVAGQRGPKVGERLKIDEDFDRREREAEESSDD